jgi:anhydro-N-acetylmuramic acid kinase
MNTQIQKLYNISKKKTRHIIGLMSGTSLDGLDLAHCRITGAGADTKVQLLHFETVDYSLETKMRIMNIFAKKNIDFQALTLLNAWLGRFHGALINDFLKKNQLPNTLIDAIASHGQTVFHAPSILHHIPNMPDATLQIGDGDHIAVTTNILTLSDFRQKHVAAGGAGAPLAVYGDYFIFSKRGENRILLNLGGIANFTYLPASCDAREVFTTDTGTGNTLSDAWIRRFLPNEFYDKDGAMAGLGFVLPELLKVLKTNEFFQKPFPKTTGPELFSIQYVEDAMTQIGMPYPKTMDEKCDLMRTLIQFSAETIAEAIENLMITNKVKLSDFKIYLSGGGTHNPVLMESLRQALPNVPFYKTDDLGISGDAKEAVLFAILANECLAGGKTHFGDRQGVPNVTMGKISFPN